MTIVLLRRRPVVSGVRRCPERDPAFTPSVRAETDGVGGRSSPEGDLSESLWLLLVAIWGDWVREVRCVSEVGLFLIW